MPIQNTYSINDLVKERKSASDTITNMLKRQQSMGGKPTHSDLYDATFSQMQALSGAANVPPPRTMEQVRDERVASEMRPSLDILKVVDDSIKAGSEEAKRLKEAADMFADNPEDLARLFEAANSDAEEVNSSNAASFFATKARELGLRSVKKQQADAQLNYSLAKMNNGSSQIIPYGAGAISTEQPSLVTTPAVTASGVTADGKDMSGMLMPPPAIEGSSPNPANIGMAPSASDNSMTRPVLNRPVYTETLKIGNRTAGKGNKFLVDANGIPVAEVPVDYDQSTGQVIGGSKFEPKATDKAYSEAALYDDMFSLRSSFKGEYAQPAKLPALNEQAIEAYKRLNPNKIELVNWWNNYNSLVNKTRNALFGATLTGAEAAAFAASTVTPNTNQENVKKYLKTQSEILKKARLRYVAMQLENGVNPRALAASFGMTVEDVMSTTKELENFAKMKKQEETEIEIKDKLENMTQAELEEYRKGL